MMVHNIIGHYNEIVRYVTVIYEGFEKNIHHVRLKSILKYFS